MPKRNDATDGMVVSLDMVRPYDFAVSLRSMRSFQPAQPEQGNTLRLAARIDEIPVLIEVSQGPGIKNKLIASSVQNVRASHIRRIAEWVLFAELDLMPFYRLITKNPKLAAVTHPLYGLKPMRPISLFEMAVVAITEQQISLAAAYGIRSRLIRRFGEPINNEWVFPESYALSKATLEELRSCGLSRQKSQYIQELASKITSGTLDLDVLKTMDDDKARETIMGLRGFGRWSADYILVRGLARPDCVPIDDLGVRSVIGEYMGNAERLSSLEVTRILEPFRPYRGILAFYLLAAHRLKLTPGR